MSTFEPTPGAEEHHHDALLHSHRHFHVTHNHNRLTGGFDHLWSDHDHEHDHAELTHAHVPHQDFDHEHEGEAHIHDHVEPARREGIGSSARATVKKAPARKSSAGRSASA